MKIYFCFGSYEWKSKLESAYSFMLKYSKITVCVVTENKMRLWRPKLSFDLFLFYAFALLIYILPCMTQNDSVSHFHFIYPQYCSYSDTFHMVKIESVSKILVVAFATTRKTCVKIGIRFGTWKLSWLKALHICSKTNLKSIIFKANLWLIHSSFKSEDPTFLELDLCPRRSC